MARRISTSRSRAGCSGWSIASDRPRAAHVADLVHHREYHHTTRTFDSKNKVRSIALALAVAACSLPTVAPEPATTDIGTTDPAALGKSFPAKPPYSPYAGRNFPIRPF